MGARNAGGPRGQLGLQGSRVFSVDGPGCCIGLAFGLQVAGSLNFGLRLGWT